MEKYTFEALYVSLGTDQRTRGAIEAETPEVAYDKVIKQLKSDINYYLGSRCHGEVYISVKKEIEVVHKTIVRPIE